MIRDKHLEEAWYWLGNHIVDYEQFQRSSIIHFGPTCLQAQRWNEMSSWNNGGMNWSLCQSYNICFKTSNLSKTSCALLPWFWQLLIFQHESDWKERHYFWKIYSLHTFISHLPQHKRRLVQLVGIQKGTLIILEPFAGENVQDSIKKEKRYEANLTDGTRDAEPDESLLGNIS